MSLSGGSRDARAIVIGMAIVLLALTVFRGLPAARDLYAREGARASLARQRLADATRAIEASPRLKDSLANADALWKSARARLFVAETPNLLAALVTAHVKRLARSASVEVRSMQVRGDTAATGGIRIVHVIASIQGDIRGISTLIASLEGGSKLFAVRSLTVSQSDVIGRPDTPERLSVEMTARTVSMENPR